jgi:hypothetical protein
MPPDPDDMLEAMGEIIRRDNRKLALEQQLGRPLEMTDAEKRAQAISFVYGNIKLSDPDNPYITRALVEAIVDGAPKEEVDAILARTKKAEEAQQHLDFKE